MLRTGREAIKQEAKGLQALAAKLDRSYEQACELLCSPGLVIVTGVGKSGHVGRKIAATMVSLGTQAVFLHPTEAAHGDMGLVKGAGCVLALSRSGGAVELFALLSFAKSEEIPRVLISENKDGALASLSSCVITIPKVAEAWGHAPTTSTAMQMAVGDALAISLADVMGFTSKDFARTHPGGAIAGLVAR